MIEAESTGRPEAAFILLLLQSLFWTIAGISAVPFALAGERRMAVYAGITLLLALGTCLTGLGVLWRRGRARGLAIALEAVCLGGTALLFLLPIGANKGLVSVLVNAALPLAVVVLLRKDGEAFT